MTLNEALNYDQEKEHPHINDDGTVKDEGFYWVVREFGRQLKKSKIEAIQFYHKVAPEAKEKIDRVYEHELLDMKTDRRYKSLFKI